MAYWSRPDYVPGRLPGRSVEKAGRPPGRPVEEASRPACRKVHRKKAVNRPVDRQARLDFPFRIQIPFLDRIKSNLGFLKSRDSVAINRG